MKINVNGSQVEHSGDATLASLLSDMSINKDRVAIMIDGNVIKKHDIDTTALTDDCHIDILSMAAGG
ncbi:thiamine biosynthesis protein ThiS [bacterium E08(2017)]|nr:thiamine biosynthesis protein ThiS [bacterium E08(2017)]